MMNYLKNTKAIVKKVLWGFFVGFCIGITPYLIDVAAEIRGYSAIGIEYGMPLLPLLVYGAKAVLKKGGERK